MGKSNVGIAANGIKAAGAIQERYNIAEKQGYLEKLFTPNIHLKFSGIGQFHLIRPANTIFRNRDSFQNLLIKTYGTEETVNKLQTDNDLIRYLLFEE
jgi:hypothetical protein